MTGKVLLRQNKLWAKPW